MVRENHECFVKNTSAFLAKADARKHLDHNIITIFYYVYNIYI